MNGFMVPCSGKMVLLDKLLPKLKREGHKVGVNVDESIFTSLFSDVTINTSLFVPSIGAYLLANGQDDRSYRGVLRVQVK